MARSLAVLTDDANQEVEPGRRQAGRVGPQPSQRQRERSCRTEFRGRARHSAGDPVGAPAQGARSVAGVRHAAGGARRSRDGRRRARRGAVGGHHPAQVQRAAPAQAAAAATRDPRAARLRRQDSTSTPAARRSSTTSWRKSAWRASTPCGRAPKPCRCQRKSTNHNDGSTGSSSDAAKGGRRRRPCPPARRRAVVRRAVRWRRLPGADRRRGRVASHHGLDRRPRAAGRIAPRRRHCPRTGAERWVALTPRCFPSTSARQGGPEAAARDGALRGAGRGARRRAGAARAHARRPGRDRAARPRPRLRSQVDRGHAAVGSAVVSAAARRAAGTDPGRLRRAWPDAVAGPAQRRPPVHPLAAAHRGAAAAGGRARRRGGRGAGPHRRRVARGHRRPRRRGGARVGGGDRRGRTRRRRGWPNCPPRSGAG